MAHQQNQNRPGSPMSEASFRSADAAQDPMAPGPVPGLNGPLGPAFAAVVSNPPAGAGAGTGPFDPNAPATAGQMQTTLNVITNGQAANNNASQLLSEQLTDVRNTQTDLRELMQQVLREMREARTGGGGGGWHTIGGNAGAGPSGNGKRPADGPANPRVPIAPGSPAPTSEEMRALGLCTKCAAEGFRTRYGLCPVHNPRVAKRG